MSSYQKSSGLSGTDFLRMFASGQASGASTGPVFGPIRSSSSSASSSYGGSHCPPTSSSLSDTESCRSTPVRPAKNFKDTFSPMSPASNYCGSPAPFGGPTFASPAFKQAPSAMDVPMPSFL
eukprot:GDKI01000121.1.p4 GENE.GDKI01000121.1~~GDKI01000121.1.p4  ORF type:complete len:122 (-),score=24.60 GDKI01000121.1:1106-1471(-)